MVAAVTGAAAPFDRRPLVILAGWLGCQQRSLRRYEELYEGKGFQVITRIASPAAVVESVFRNNNSSPTLRQHTVVSRRHSSSMMQDLAFDILMKVKQSACETFFFHAFSNSGCFVWEQVRQLLDTTSYDGENLGSYPSDGGLIVPEGDDQKGFASLRNRLAGVVFDSCPGTKLHLIGQALKYCTWIERLKVVRLIGFNNIFLPHRSASQRKIMQREEAYVTSLKYDKWNVPQLYLYSCSDPLIHFPSLDELVRYRMAVCKLGKNNLVFRRVWPNSPHCAHLLKHPAEYKAAVNDFVDKAYQLREKIENTPKLVSRL